MEEYDSLAAGPREDGSVDLSHDTWRTLPSELSGFASKLLHLNVCNNQLPRIPSAIGDLVLLQTLDVSFNQIESIDGAIGKCIRLRRLNVSRNRLEALPPEIGCCTVLEEINASDNNLTSLPQELLNLFVISVIDARNNRLRTVPTELSRMPTLTQLLCDGNPHLSSAPENMRGDSKLLLFCLETQQKFKDALDPKETQRQALQSQSDQLHRELAEARDQIRTLEEEVANLEWERPDRYLYWKRRLVEFTRRVRDRMMNWLERAWRAFRRWRDRRRTHPLY